MPLTNAQKQARFVARRKAKLERLAVLEGAMRRILDLEVRSVHDDYASDGSFIWVDYINRDDVWDIARKALGDVG